jgi:tyrosine-protein phosphatase SIW14
MMQIINKKIILLIAIFIASCTSQPHSSTIRNKSWASKIKTSTLNNLYKINDSMYRSEQPTYQEFKYLNQFGIKSILNLRANHNDSNLIKNNNLEKYSVKITTNNITEDNIIASLKIINAAKKPLLIHCKHGSDRTGIVVAMYRIVFENWTKENAIDELINGGYGFHHQYDNIPAYIRNVDINAIKKMISM